MAVVDLDNGAERNGSEVSQTGCCAEDLAHIADEFKEISAADRIEAQTDIIDAENGAEPCLLLKQLALRKAQGCSQRPRLSLAGEGFGLSALQKEGEVFAVGACEGLAHFEFSDAKPLPVLAQRLFRIVHLGRAAVL